MIILTIRTDNPMAEIGLFDNAVQLGYESWQAHRKLAETLHTKIKDLLEKNGKSWSDLGGIGAYAGPGSFTGLRIGLSVANALAASYTLPIAATSGDAWLERVLVTLSAGQAKTLPIIPDYGAPVHITPPRH